MTTPPRVSRGSSSRVWLPRGEVRGIALVLHGGQSRSLAPTRPWQLAVLRMIPFARALRGAGAEQGLAVVRLRYRLRGWNGADRASVYDAQRALDQLAGRFPNIPVALVGHSMGARTALYVAGHHAVRTVVGLAPWIEADDAAATLDGLAGRRVLIVHGERDRMTDPRASAGYARAAAKSAASVTYVEVAASRHAMLERAVVWHDLTTGFVLGTLWGQAPAGTPARGGTNDKTNQALAGALAGKPALVV